MGKIGPAPQSDASFQSVIGGSSQSQRTVTVFPLSFLPSPLEVVRLPSSSGSPVRSRAALWPAGLGGLVSHRMH